MTMLEQALVAGHVVLSSSGAHAREDWHKIITRKRADIARANHTVWVVNSNATRPETVQSFCNDHDARYVIFVSRSRDSKANSGPSTANRANECSSDGKIGFPFGQKIPKDYRRSPEGLIEQRRGFGSMCLKKSIPVKTHFGDISR